LHEGEEDADRQTSPVCTLGTEPLHLLNPSRLHHFRAPFALTVDPSLRASCGQVLLISWRFGGLVQPQADPRCRVRGWHRAPTRWRCLGGRQWILSGRWPIWSLTGSPCLGCAPPHPFQPCLRRLAPASLHVHRSVRVDNLLTLDLGSGAPPPCDWKTWGILAGWDESSRRCRHCSEKNTWHGRH
jgi:hypothetical protein